MGALDEVECGWMRATARWIRTAQHMITHANLAMDQESFWQHLQTASHPSDWPLPLEWRAYYWRLVEVTRALRPRRICEIGVRAGYSALAMLTAAPTAYMLGIEADLDETKENTHCGRKGLYRHALEMLREFNYDLLIVNSHAIGRLPKFDLAYIDGEHTFHGCLADLHMVTQTCDTVLVDDVVSSKLAAVDGHRPRRHVARPSAETASAQAAAALGAARAPANRRPSAPSPCATARGKSA